MRTIGIRISRTSSSTTDGAVGLRDRLLAAAAASGVVLRVADGIVRVGSPRNGRRRPGRAAATRD